MVENNGENRWVLDGGHFEMTQKNGASDRWTKGTYVVRDNIVEFTSRTTAASPRTIRPREKRARSSPYTWSLYRDKLTLGPVEGAVSPENFSAKPWDAGRLDPRVDRNLGEEPSATARQALHGEPAAQGFDAVGEAAQAGASGGIRAADAVVGDLHDQPAAGLG